MRNPDRPASCQVQPWDSSCVIGIARLRAADVGSLELLPTKGDAVAALEPEMQDRTHQPVDAVAERLNDPAVAASLVTLLDNAELLSTLVLGLSGLMERGDVIMESIGEAVREVQGSGAVTPPDGAPTIAELGAIAAQLKTATPLLGQVLESPMASPETIDLLSLLSEAGTEGAANARSNDTKVTGAISAVRSLRDPDVQQGLGLLIEIARSLGRRM